MENSPELTLLSATDSFNLTFSDDSGVVGRFWYEDGSLHFEGTATEAASIFTDYVIKLFEEWERGR